MVLTAILRLVQTRFDLRVLRRYLVQLRLPALLVLLEPLMPSLLVRYPPIHFEATEKAGQFTGTSLKRSNERQPVLEKLESGLSFDGILSL